MIEATPEPEPTKPPIPDDLLRASSEQLCAELQQIKTIPTFEPTPTDSIYEALIAKSNAAIPCLVSRISDKTPMKDPRYSVPNWQHFAVGDTAVFILLDIVARGDDMLWENLMKEMLSAKYSKEWKTNGIYAYFNYVSEPKNRIELQRWWKKWLEDNKT
ncbi:MAG: hypothetical protein ABIO36_04720 [Pyrinomonadaceae bacterium]